jgi:hypothetical protein
MSTLKMSGARSRWARQMKWDKYQRKLWFDVIRNARGLCQVCHVETATQVHHFNYPSHRRDQARDLIAICDDCHYIIHHPTEIMAANDNEPELPLAANDNEVLEVRKRGA